MAFPAFPRSQLVTLIQEVSELPTQWDGDPEPFVSQKGISASFANTIVYLDTFTQAVNGTEEIRRTYDAGTDTITSTLNGLRHVVLRVKVKSYDVNHVTADVIERVWFRLRRPSSQFELRTLGLAIIKREAITTIPLKEDGRDVMWGTMDIHMGWAINEVDSTDDGASVQYMDGVVTNTADPGDPPVYVVDPTVEIPFNKL